MVDEACRQEGSPVSVDAHDLPVECPASLLEEICEASSSFAEFVSIVRAHDALAGGKRKRLQNTGKLDSQERRFRFRCKRNAAKPKSAP